MTFEQSIYLAVFVLWLLTTIQATQAFWEGVRFHRYIKRMVRKAPDLKTPEGRFKYQPRAAVILPCCGVDEKLEQTLQGLAHQNYADYHIIFTFESADDPAYEAVTRWTKEWKSPRRECVVAGRTEQRSQKIHNLLAALKKVSDDREVLAFIDSDAVPHSDWLGHLIAPLADNTVGAATGYRWYTATGGIAAGVRSCWNASTITMLGDDKHNFCWGGATAIRKATFEKTGIAKRWDRALSDDLQVTLAMRAAGLQIRFVPQAIIPSADRTTISGLIEFARRQLIITRICSPRMWWAGLTLTVNFMLGGTATCALFLVAALGWFGTATVMWFALAGWLCIIALAGGKAVLRQLGLRHVLRPPDLTWRDILWDVLGTLSFSGSLHMHLFMTAALPRRSVWRNTVYEMVSPEETHVLGRTDKKKP